jgi:tetratricopeptide (TPR) repeat protein
MSMILVSLMCISGNVYDDFFEMGTVAYGENRLEDAIQSYERLHDSGVRNAPTYYNLGSAYYHSGETGFAVLNYERALAVDPTFDPALRGLDAVAASMSGPLQMAPGFRSRTRLYGPPARALSLVFWWLFWGILLQSVWRPSPRARWRAAGAFGLLLLTAASAIYLSRSPGAAVVLSAESSLRYGPDVRDEIRIPLTAGDRVCIEESRGAWVRIVTGAEQRGWVEASRVGFVHPLSKP